MGLTSEDLLNTEDTKETQRIRVIRGIRLLIRVILPLIRLIYLCNKCSLNLSALSPAICLIVSKQFLQLYF